MTWNATVCFALAAVSLFAAAALWAQGGVERAVMAAQPALAAAPVTVAVARAASAAGMSVMLLALAGLVPLARWRPDLGADLRLLLPSLLSFAFAAVGGELLRLFVNRPRPFIALPGQVVALGAPDSASFPSGHAVKALALALPFVVLASNAGCARRALKLSLLAVAVAVALSRVALGVHYPSDLLGSLAVALLALPPAVAASNALIVRRRLTRGRLGVTAQLWAVVMVALAAYLATLS